MSGQIRQGETLILDETIKEPIPQNVEIFFNHFGRYFHAARLLSISGQDVVIDASCGCGYGSYGLASKAELVYGLDVNEEYLAIARKELVRENLRFYTYDHFRSFKIKADKIVCIETFEHVPADQSDAFLEQLVGWLDDRGSMFLTVPLGNNGPSAYNPFHCFEPDMKTLYEKLSRWFGTIQMEIDSFRNSFGHDSEFCYLVLRNKKG